MLNDPFIFTEDSIVLKKYTAEETELQHKYRSKTLMVRQLGKVEVKKSKAEKADQKKLDNVQLNAGGKKASINCQTSSPDNNDNDDWEVGNDPKQER